MAKSFAAQVTKHTVKSKQRMNAVFKQSVQEVLIEANTPVAQGGRMRVDTGFLRNSLTASLNTPASGPSNPRSDSQGNADDVALVIAGATVKDVIWAGWSANYARAREYKDGFLESAAQKWSKIVRKNAARAKREIK